MIPAQGDLDLPKKSTGTKGYWFGADGSDTITESNLTFTTLQLRPRFVAGLAKVSYKMLIQTGGGVENIIAQDIAATLAELKDLNALQGTGSNSQPTGVLNAGIGSLTWGGGTSPLESDPNVFWWLYALASEKALIDAKAYTENLSWLCDSASWKIMRQASIYDTDYKNLVDTQGNVLGFQMKPTTHMPDNTVLFGNWQDLVMAT